MTATMTSTNKPQGDSQSTPWWRTWPILTATALAVILSLWAFGSMLGGEGDADNGPIYKVARGPMTIHVTEAGTIQAREQVVLKCEVEGQTTIIWIVEERRPAGRARLQRTPGRAAGATDPRQERRGLLHPRP